MRTAACLLMMLLAAPAAMAGQVVSLENDSLRAQWDAGRGTLVSLKDKATGREWLATAVVTPVYAIQLTDEKSPISSASAAAIVVRQRQGAVIIEGSHDAPAGFAVTCKFWLEKDSRLVLGRIAIRSQAPCRIAEVRFPLVTLRLPFAGSGQEDRVLWPECDGTLLRNPGLSRADRQFRYPGTASMQMMAAFDPAAGLYLAARDCEAHMKTFCTRRNSKNLAHVCQFRGGQGPAVTASSTP